MTPTSPTDVVKLVHVQSDYFVSLYLPCAPRGEGSCPNRERFRDLLAIAEESLLSMGFALRSVQQFLRPARDLLRSPRFWQTLTPGLAVILERGGIHVWHLPERCPELCVVGPRCYLVPLLSAGDHRGTTPWHVVSRSSGRAIENLHDILLEAQEGNVATLYLNPRVRILGMLSPRTGDLRIDDALRPDSEDLLNLAAVMVLRHEGCVYAMPPDCTRCTTPAVAFLRVTDRAIQMHSKPNGFPARSTYIEENGHEHQKVSR